MRQEILDEDRLPRGRTIWKILRDAVIERDLALFDQHHDRRRDELFSDGPGLKNSLWAHRHGELDVGQTVPFGEEDVSAAVDSDSNSGNLLAHHFRAHKGVDRFDLPS